MVIGEAEIRLYLHQDKLKIVKERTILKYMLTETALASPIINKAWIRMSKEC